MTKRELVEINKKRNGGTLRCYICGKELDESKPKTYIKEHKNNNNKDENPGNLDIAHRSCNKKKDPPRIQNHVKNKELNIFSYTHVYRQKLGEKLSVGSVAMHKNHYGQTAALKYAFKKLKQSGLYGSLPFKDNIKNMAIKANVRSSTMYDWLDDWNCSEGYFEIAGESFRFNEKTRKRIFKNEIDKYAK